jgi:hypothetical protein
MIELQQCVVHWHFGTFFAPSLSRTKEIAIKLHLVEYNSVALH